MKIDNPVETLIGAIVIVVAVGFGFYANQQSGGDIGASHYPVVGKFSNAAGVAPGTDVRIAGVKVGSVSTIELDPADYEATIIMSVRQNVDIPVDTLAKIDSEGLLGGTYISLEPGASDDPMTSGDSFEFTQGAISLTTLLTKFITNTGGDQ
ncbi:MAG: outer membrane lipid asymmetry maintenance protein MlaD [Pseudomonadota bacterium]